MATVKRSAVKPPPVYVPADDNGRAFAYVKLPLGPEIVAALQEHADNARRLVELFTGAELHGGAVLEAVRKTSAALERDAAKVRGALARRRAKQARAKR